jgi:hypothetical protein
MLKYKTVLFPFLSCILLSLQALNLAAQGPEATGSGIFAFPDRFLAKLESKASRLEAKVVSETEKSIDRLKRQEQKLKNRLMKKDSVAAKQLFADSEKQYDELIEKMRSGSFPAIEGKKYDAHLDTLATSLKFLDKNNIEGKVKENSQLLTSARDKLKGVDDKLDYTQYVKDYIKQRQNLLKEQCQRFGLLKSLTKYNKQVYYYSAQISEYKSILKQPDLLERKVISELQKLPVFQDFMQKNSQFAALFPMPSANGAAALSGFQTRDQVNQIIQSQAGLSGPGATAALKQQLQGAEAAMGSIQDKLQNKLSNGGSEMPDFKPNDQKTKSLWKRLELGTNLQTVRSNAFFPSTSDVGLSLGYKLTEAGTAGIGASYKMGWGKDIKHMKISHEGIGLRSFLDWKLKGSFYVSGGYEQNYRSSFKAMSDLHGISQWQQSGLIGISKIISLNTKVFKKTKAQLLWDFLSYRQLPREQPIKFRLGYNF